MLSLCAVIRRGNDKGFGGRMRQFFLRSKKVGLTDARQHHELKIQLSSDSTVKRTENVQILNYGREI
jgi:hypothetical protein